LGSTQLSVLRESCDATSIASGPDRVVAVISWMLPPACPVTKLRGGGSARLMGSSCELLSCVDAPTASLHSCTVSSRTKRSTSTSVRPRLRHGRARKLGAAQGEHVRFLVNAQCVGVPAVHAALLHRQLSISHTSFTLCTHPSAATTCTTCGELTYDGAGAYVTRRHTPGTYARSLEPGGSAARAIVLCGKGSK
jgi:hypothetical protein